METSTESILRKLKQVGLKFTGKREETVNFFVCNQDKYVSAKDVYEHVKQTFPRVSFDTIYRTLTTLLEHGIIERMEFSDDSAKYRLKCQNVHHHHLVCLQCGTTVPIRECPMPAIEENIHNFKVVTHRFEVYGYCQQCLEVS